MLSDFCYYFISSSLMTAFLLSSYYHYDKENAKKLIFNISWNGTYYYIKTKSHLQALTQSYNEASDSDFESDEEDDLDNASFLLFDSKNLHSLNLTNMEDLEDISLNNFNTTITLLQNGAEFRRILETDFKKDEIKFDIIEKQFIQVELLVDDKEVDIHHHIKEHYFKNNTILDKEFLLWFLNYYNYNDISLDSIRSGKYLLKIIDKNVEMLDLESHEGIILLEDNSYKKVEV
jgi:hypothetical protein